MKARNHEAEVTYRPDSPPVPLAICGDPVVGRALVLLLRGSGYDARFLPVSSLDEPGSLEGAQLLLLTPTSELGTERRNALFASLKYALGATKIPVLELVTTSEEAREEARDGSRYVVSWPCRTEDLKQQIGIALLTGADQTAPQGSQVGERKEDDDA